MSESAGRFSLAEHYSRIVKRRPPAAREPNLPDYERMVRDFSWDAARSQLDGLPGNRGLNIAHEAVDRHAEGHRAVLADDGDRLVDLGVLGVGELGDVAFDAGDEPADAVGFQNGA